MNLRRSKSVFLLLLVLSLIGCEKNQTRTSTTSKPEPTEREYEYVVQKEPLKIPILAKVSFGFVSDLQLESRLIGPEKSAAEKIVDSFVRCGILLREEFGCIGMRPDRGLEYEIFDREKDTYRLFHLFYNKEYSYALVIDPKHNSETELFGNPWIEIWIFKMSEAEIRSASYDKLDLPKDSVLVGKFKIDPNSEQIFNQWKSSPQNIYQIYHLVDAIRHRVISVENSDEVVNQLLSKHVTEICRARDQAYQSETMQYVYSERKNLSKDVRLQLADCFLDSENDDLFGLAGLLKIDFHSNDLDLRNQLSERASSMSNWIADTVQSRLSRLSP